MIFVHPCFFCFAYTLKDKIIIFYKERVDITMKAKKNGRRSYDEAE